MKKILLCITIIFSLLLTSCDDDWIPYENTDYNINYAVKGNIFVISDVEEELSALAEEYDSNVKLTFVQYKFENETDGNAEFQFFREYEKNGKYYSVLITLFANISDNTVYKLKYEEGISKRVTGFHNPITRSNENAYDIYISALDSAESGELSYINVMFWGDNINVDYIGKENTLISRFEI